MNLENHSPFAATLYQRNDSDAPILIIKGSWQFDQHGELTPCPAVLFDTDQWTGEKGHSSLRHASDLVPYKDNSELLLSGSAHPTAANLRQMDVSVSLRADSWQWTKALRINGERQWQRSLVGTKISARKALTSLPLHYEFAYGGQTADEAYNKNPVGVGYVTKVRDCKGVALPQIEYPDQLIERPMQHVAPAGFAPLVIDWQPRLGTIKRAQKKKTGQLPLGYYNSAPTDQQFIHTLVGGEILSLRGFFADQAEGVELRLPTVLPKVELPLQADNLPLEPKCDTLLVDTDAQVISLVWRVAVAQVDEVQVVRIR